jgi:hypothetical protein
MRNHHSLQAKRRRKQRRAKLVQPGILGAMLMKAGVAASKVAESLYKAAKAIAPIGEAWKAAIQNTKFFDGKIDNKTSFRALYKLHREMKSNNCQSCPYQQAFTQESNGCPNPECPSYDPMWRARHLKNL